MKGLPALALLLVFGGLALIASQETNFAGIELGKNWMHGIATFCIVLGCTVLGGIVNFIAEKVSKA